jgi:predicted P-loop ATPase
LVLTGDQGAYKTTWLTNLCPPSLKEYIFTGKIDVDKNDTQSMLSEFLIINIDDQLRNLNRKDENALKTLITLESVKVRKPYDRMITKRPRIASFCGSVNGNDFLTDPSGSRRFLPFEVKSIDLEEFQKINIDAVWAEALQLFHSGFRYWFTKEEIAEINNHNQEFEVTDAETELLLELYEAVPRNSPESEELTSSIILYNLETHFNTKLSGKKLGEALNKLKFVRFGKKIKGSSKYLFAVKRKIANENSRVVG